MVQRVSNYYQSSNFEVIKVVGKLCYNIYRGIITWLLSKIFFTSNNQTWHQSSNIEILQHVCRGGTKTIYTIRFYLPTNWSGEERHSFHMHHTPLFIAWFYSVRSSQKPPHSPTLTTAICSQIISTSTANSYHEKVAINEPDNRLHFYCINKCCYAKK